MRTVGFFFVMMIAVVLQPGTSLARQADHPSQQARSQTGDNSDSAHRTNFEVRDENGQPRSGKADQISQRPASLTKTTTKRRSSANRPQQTVTHPRRLNKTPATNGPRIDTPATVTGLQSLKTAIPVPNQALGHRSLLAPSSSGSVNGQRFKNSRDPGAHLAISGGPLTAARGTAAINGTNMKRKP